MRSTISLPAGLAAVILLASTTTVSAHTWVEQVRKVASNGSFVGAPGFIRNFGPRTAGVNIDAVNSNLLPPNGRSNAFLQTDLMCKSNQLKGQQTKDYPTLKASPLEQIALQYHDNGHVTLYDTNQGKPAGRGTVFVYGTSQSLDSDTYLGIHRVWNAEGTGGDKRGKLLATRPYDDGRCFQVNRGSKLRQASINYPTDKSEDILCQTDVQLPADAPTSGDYTIYWVWEWPTLGKDGKIVVNESYTSCMDISMSSKPLLTAGKFIAQKPVGLDANNVAIEAQIIDQFLVDPTAQPSLTSDNMPGGGATQMNQGVAPVTMSGSPAQATPVVTASNSKANPITQPVPTLKPTLAPNQGFLTITVTAKEIETVYITLNPAASASSKPTAKNPLTLTSTVTVIATVSSSAPAISSPAFTTFPAVPMSSATATGAPQPSPFLTPNNQVQNGGVAPTRRRKRSARIDIRS
ncbi:uncharacterized protein RAG0_07522 [Rhynchosporium agropyri]|uniref:DUF7492 domain-containing protein n=1 Tax=Rhynchosporium agropyri TaxID=914238 RepID=A0A1E1KQ31_9HELO|nr:uncharacterized protein RAG0_07522 [Rhynchosporium agropyri]